MSNFNVDISVLDVDIIRDLLEILVKNIDDLPPEVLVALKLMSNMEPLTIDRISMNQKGYGDVVDGGEIDGMPVKSVNLVTKMVTVFDGPTKEAVDLYPKHYKLATANNVVVEW